MAVSETIKTKRRKRSRRIFIGLVVVILMVLGVAFIITSIVNRVNVILDDSDEKLQYAQLYSAMVALDPAPFDSLENADPNLLLEAAIWSAFTNEDSSSWPRTEDTGQLTISTVIVDRYAEKMYGPDYKLTHRTFSDVSNSEVIFEYDSENEYYILPITSLAGSYSPVVEQITTDGNTKTLHIAYLSSADTEEQQYNGEVDQNNVVKYMDYVLVRISNDYYLYSVKSSTSSSSSS